MFPPRSTFHMEFKSIFLFVYVTGSIGGTLFLGIWALLDPSLQAVPTYVLLDTIGHYVVFFTPAYSAVCAFIVSRYFRYTITARGMGGQNLFGSARFAKWEEIVEIKPLKVGNLRFIRLYTNDGGLPVWLPMFVRDDEAMGGTILKWAPENSVARTIIRTVHVAA